MMKKKQAIACFSLLLTVCSLHGQSIKKVFPGADNKTPSVAMYFDWVNRNWRGSNETKALTGLDFFKWLNQAYGMKLDIFMLDAGVFDNGPRCKTIPGRPAYGDLNSPWFTSAYPHGLSSIYKKASSFDCRLGLWLGVDGFGNTAEDAQKRIDLLVSLCRDYKMKLFKMDACCSMLRPEKEPYFIKAMEEARKFSPDLILLNHRINLSETARKYTTTFLWEDKETYIDALSFNDTTATHHRQGNMSRGLPPGMSRLAEDHGVCISSCIDYWDDDLILQGFNRGLIMSPEIYGNPWLLRDDEYPKLAAIYNLHRKYDDILVNGKQLPPSYGFKAVSRGNNETRIISLRNLSWETKRITIDLDSTIGINTKKKLNVTQFHPVGSFIGTYNPGNKVTVEVLPFRSALFIVSAKNDSYLIKGAEYQIVQDVNEKPLKINIVGMPGTKARLSIQSGDRKFSTATLDGKPANLVLNKGLDISFPGKALKEAFHRKLANLEISEIPQQSNNFYEALCFANDNNALEVRSLKRAGPSRFSAVNAARDAFFKDSVFIDLGVWDKFAFDNNLSTSFKGNAHLFPGSDVPMGALRLDIGGIKSLDKIVLYGVSNDYKPGRAFVSVDLKSWTPVTVNKEGDMVNISITGKQEFRYLKIDVAPIKVAEIKGFVKGRPVLRNGWRASNLFPENFDKPKIAWKNNITLTEAGNGSYLALAVPGKYKNDKVFSVLKIGDQLISPTDRSPSFLYNNWEHYETKPGNYTFYFPVTSEMVNKKIEVILIGSEDGLQKIKPEIWITNYLKPLEQKTLVLN
jgi:hypothetical protein